ncbi:MAG TPA: TRAP transporter large permease subunit [Casimicrobiaceae bacterium]|nr:TRAP transporter large permease subunit [Casimicrobiaceae bacterium]
MESLATGEILSVCLFFALIAALMLGYPIAFTLPGVAFIFAIVGWALGAFDLSYLEALPLRYWGIVTNEVLIAVPLFVFMGVMLERSRLAETLLTTMGELFGSLPGGLGISTIVVATLLAASTGIVGATVVTMGLISLPAMLRARYDKRLASGLICASGTLCQLIPPSTILVFLAVILQSAYSEAQMAKGNFTPVTLSVGDLFAGAFIPGIVLSGLYIVWVIGNAFLKPGSAPALKKTSEGRRAFGGRIVVALLPPLMLIVAVLGSILAGVATPTEAASVGAIGAALLTLVKLLAEHFARRLAPEAVQRALCRFWLAFFAVTVVLAVVTGALGVLTLAAVSLVAGVAAASAIPGVRRQFFGIVDDVSRSTLTITAMVFVIFMGASVFSVVFTRLGGAQLVHDSLASMPGGATGALFVVMLVMFILGCFLDPFEIIFVVVPVVGPVLFKMDVNPIWFAIMIGVNLQTSYLTPPFGFSLFFLKGVAPPEVTTGDIYRGIIPYVGIQLVCLAILWVYPALATWLPAAIYGR